MSGYKANNTQLNMTHRKISKQTKANGSDWYSKNLFLGNLMQPFLDRLLDLSKNYAQFGRQRADNQEAGMENGGKEGKRRLEKHNKRKGVCSTRKYVRRRRQSDWRRAEEDDDGKIRIWIVRIKSKKLVGAAMQCGVTNLCAFVCGSFSHWSVSRGQWTSFFWILFIFIFFES